MSRCDDDGYLFSFQCRLYWQNQGDFLCVRVDRHTKTKKSIFCSLEIFSVREKDFPVEVVELKGTSRVFYIICLACDMACRYGHGLFVGA
jgi:hypothetical protein